VAVWRNYKTPNTACISWRKKEGKFIRQAMSDNLQSEACIGHSVANGMLDSPRSLRQNQVVDQMICFLGSRS
jgi:hypothetical protein